jgi:hypothetical protein
MPGRIAVVEEVGASVEPEPEDFPGLCRVCGSAVPPAGDPASCTPSLCSERCLAQAILKYWADLGLEARVTLRDGYARLEGLRGIFPPA